MTKKTIYFPGLNGLRAIAAIAVVLSHITLYLKEFGLDPGILGSIQNGELHGLPLAGYGVSIFFVLSGFLITYLLQAEKDVHPIDIKKFYLRRILRIWPLYYLYLAACIITILSQGMDLNIKSMFLYIFYAANIPFVLGTALPFVSHYWSLGVEEQFYLFWPWFNKKINSIIKPILVLIIILVGAKLALHFLYPDSLAESFIHVTRFHCMMIGALGAVLYKQNHKLFLQITDNKISQICCWTIILLLAVNKFHVASVIDNEIISVVALFLIIGQIRIKNRVINLENNVFDFLGKISYGIYVIHPLLIFFSPGVLNLIDIGTPYKYFIVYLSILGVTIFIAYLSYTYFEKVFLNFKKKFVVVDSAGTRNFRE